MSINSEIDSIGALIIFINTPDPRRRTAIIACRIPYSVVIRLFFHGQRSFDRFTLRHSHVNIGAFVCDWFALRRRPAHTGINAQFKFMTVVANVFFNLTVISITFCPATGAPRTQPFRQHVRPAIDDRPSCIR